MNLYFAYGSNMWRQQMKKRCPDHQYVGGGSLNDYRWIISSRGYANIVISPREVVYGVVYRISGSDEKKLDSYEGVHSGSYRKEHLSVEINGIPTDCLIYVDPTEGEGSPIDEYIDRINKGIVDADLPAVYVEGVIRKFVPGGTASRPIVYR
jgi:gamma-glutamylcyclotransferase (GGCT)/AIG2-like uncharacterized protein YtfP